MVLEARAMPQQAPQGDGNAALRRWDGEIEICVHVAVEIELALVHELHHGDAGEQLGDRAGPH